MIWKRKALKGEGAALTGAETKDQAARADVGVVAEERVDTVPAHWAGVNQKGGGSFTPSNVDEFMGRGAGPGLPFAPLPLSQTLSRSYRVPRSYRIKGDILSTRPVEVLGDLEGQKLVAGLVTVLPGGVLRGDSYVDVLRVAGAVSGEVRAKSLVDVVTQGEVTGTLVTPSVRILPGARVAGAKLSVGAKA